MDECERHVTITSIRLELDDDSDIRVLSNIYHEHCGHSELLSRKTSTYIMYDVRLL